ncbi:MAG: hypothetical protein HY659_01830 [Rhizobiales bacterium]|nr:hypothetical protein [Hyphomicrobiales bacterium]
MFDLNTPWTWVILVAVLAAACAAYVMVQSYRLALPACRRVEKLIQTGVIQYLAVSWNLDDDDPRKILPVEMIVEGNAGGKPWVLEGKNEAVWLEGKVPDDVLRLWLEWQRNTAEALHCFDVLRMRKWVDVKDAIDGRPGSLVALMKA